MRLYTFDIDGKKLRLGAEQDGRLVDLSAAHQAMLAAGEAPPPSETSPFPGDMMALLQMGVAGMAMAREALAFAGASAETGGASYIYGFDDVHVRAPLPRPGKILCSGVNYRGHLDENPGAVLPKFPFFFSKLPSTVVGPGEAIVCPRITRQLDYEVELAVVIGCHAHHLDEADALDAVAGYTILHDVSARDVQFQDSQITLGKNFDTFGPMGPCLVTSGEMNDLSDVSLRTWVNGELLQDGSTRDWFYPLAELLSFLTQIMTLEPGDVVSTGTPAGVGYFRQPQIFLQPGDRVTLEIEGIGRLENPVVVEP